MHEWLLRLTARMDPKRLTHPDCVGFDDKLKKKRVRKFSPAPAGAWSFSRVGVPPPASSAVAARAPALSPLAPLAPDASATAPLVPPSGLKRKRDGDKDEKKENGGSGSGSETESDNSDEDEESEYTPEDGDSDMDGAVAAKSRRRQPKKKKQKAEKKKKVRTPRLKTPELKAAFAMNATDKKYYVQHLSHSRNLSAVLGKNFPFVFVAVFHGFSFSRAPTRQPLFRAVQVLGGRSRSRREPGQIHQGRCAHWHSSGQAAAADVPRTAQATRPRRILYIVDRRPLH